MEIRELRLHSLFNHAWEAGGGKGGLSSRSVMPSSAWGHKGDKAGIHKGGKAGLHMGRTH